MEQERKCNDGDTFRDLFSKICEDKGFVAADVANILGIKKSLAYRKLRGVSIVNDRHLSRLLAASGVKLIIVSNERGRGRPKRNKVDSRGGWNRGMNGKERLKAMNRNRVNRYRQRVKEKKLMADKVLF